MLGYVVNAIVACRVYILLSQPLLCVQKAYRAMLSTPELIQDFEASKSRPSSTRSSIRHVARYQLRSDASLEYARSIRVEELKLRRQFRSDFDHHDDVDADTKASDRSSPVISDTLLLE